MQIFKKTLAFMIATSMILNPFASYADNLSNNEESEFTDNESIIINEDSINNVDLKSIENQESFIESEQDDTNQIPQEISEDEQKNENETNDNQENNNVNDTTNDTESPDNFTETKLNYLMMVILVQLYWD